MELRLFQVDAFTSSVFHGNPAAVVPLDAWLPDATMQAIALENNLSETSFFVPLVDAETADFRLRWFTPTTEVDLCGHATLAAAHVLRDHLKWPHPVIRFLTASGVVQVRSTSGMLELDFPSRPGEPIDAIGPIADALGRVPAEAFLARDLMAVFETEDDVRGLAPDMARVAALDEFAVIVTAPCRQAGVDFVSRFFAPRSGIPEDPVTGSAHCTLIPYWATRLGKAELHARQVSPRGGELFCRNCPEIGRVLILGQAVTYLVGTINL